MINIEIIGNENESNSNLLRRFTKRVRSSGVVKKVRSIRYKTRDESKFTRKKQALRSIKRRAEIEKLIKLGKLPDTRSREKQNTDA
ncbi:hypothetical protein KJ991_00625 [Patescibacteria group bacterium]|nr:hypothetical protein [Patescibacteria group bacterium]MBU4057728.1 hypothetical protein [Patescibacteria group bacterium]MBU4116087.1 hypothetical protein [Patescibacteria group bacterium]